jgi:hypothetical protein
MIIWSGLGFLVAVIVFAFCLGIEAAVSSLTGGSDFYRQAIWPIPLALVLSGAVCWFLGRRLNKPGGKTYIDKETGEEVILQNKRHSLFFIRMDYWGPILIIIALLYAILRAFNVV